MQLAMQFLPKKMLQLGCQTYATCFATCNEIIFYAHRVFKNVSGILIMSYCDWFLLNCETSCSRVSPSVGATCRVALRKVEVASTFSGTCNARLVANMGCHTRKSSLQLAMQCNAIMLQGKLPLKSDMAFNFVIFYLILSGLVAVFQTLESL